jgi:GT2 family glycosyltransferase
VRAEELAIVVPTRDRWRILARTLDALRAQTALGFETIVVVDGDDQRCPWAIAQRTEIRLLSQEHAGPGMARNLAAQSTSRPLLLFLGDDMIPTPTLVARHLERHAREPAPTVAVLGHVDWHPEVAKDRLLRWLEWSGSQFDYRALKRQPSDEAGFGRFYSCNLTLKRDLFIAAGGFDPDFRFDYEDLDLGWRLDQRGMRLVYEPSAVVHHLHRYRWPEIVGRYQSRARAERLMAAKHSWFKPWFYERISTYANEAPTSRIWPLLVDRVPEALSPLRTRLEIRADRWYHQQLAVPFLEAWNAAEPRATGDSHASTVRPIT